MPLNAAAVAGEKICRGMPGFYVAKLAPLFCLLDVTFRFPMNQHSRKLTGHVSDARLDRPAYWYYVS